MESGLCTWAESRSAVPFMLLDSTCQYFAVSSAFLTLGDAGFIVLQANVFVCWYDTGLRNHEVNPLISPFGGHYGEF